MRTLKACAIVALLSLTMACETESSSEAGFTYNLDQPVVTTRSFLIDFESFNPGDIVSEIFIADPFESAQVAGITMAFPDSNAAMVFDSSNPTGNDFDIGTPNEMYGGPGRGNGGESNDTALGNVLILSEDLDSSDPDDIFEKGASFWFDFSANSMVTLNSFDVLDIEQSEDPTVVNLFDDKGTLLLSKVVEPGGDNSKTKVDLENIVGVAFMEIIMNSSGAIDNIAFEMAVEEVCISCDSSISELSFIFNGGASGSVIRIETVDGVLIFEEELKMDDTFSVFGDNEDGSFSGNLVFFSDGDQIGGLATDCSQIVGPGTFVRELEVTEGRTTSGGVLCPVQVAF